MARTGRKTKFDDERAALIIQMVRDGNFISTAARAAKVHPQTIDNWIKKGKAQRRGKFFLFFEALEEADALAEVDGTAEWKEHRARSPEALKEFMRRRFPHWNVADKQEIKQENTEGPDIIKERINEYFEQLKRRGIPRGLKESPLLRDGDDESVHPSSTDDEADRASDE